MIATPDINKQSETRPTETVSHSIQLVQEIETPTPVKVEEVATKTTPPQNNPQVTGCEAVRQEVAKYADWDINLMVAISKAESGCRSGARGDNHLTYQKNGRTYGYSLGVFQVRILPGRERCDTFDVQANVRCAHDIFTGQGYRAWSVFKSGAYTKHM